MTETRTLAPAIRRAGEGEKRWFFGGGVFTWKLSSANEDIHLIEVDMVEGKWTPIPLTRSRNLGTDRGHC